MEAAVQEASKDQTLIHHSTAETLVAMQETRLTPIWEETKAAVKDPILWEDRDSSLLVMVLVSKPRRAVKTTPWEDKVHSKVLHSPETIIWAVEEDSNKEIRILLLE